MSGGGAPSGACPTGPGALPFVPALVSIHLPLLGTSSPEADTVSASPATATAIEPTFRLCMGDSPLPPERESLSLDIPDFDLDGLAGFHIEPRNRRGPRRGPEPNDPRQGCAPARRAMRPPRDGSGHDGHPA